MFNAARLTFIMLPFFAVLTFTTLILSPRGVPSVPSLDERLQPGARFDWRDADCETTMGSLASYYHVSCRVRQSDGRVVYLTYKSQSIASVSMGLWHEDVTIGALILAWGTPLGRCGSRFHWAGHDAYVYTFDDVTASSLVSFLVWGNTQDAPPWQGFTNKRRTQ